MVQLKESSTKSPTRWGLWDTLTAFLVFALTWTAYTLAPMSQVGDSGHTLLVSEQLYREGTGFAFLPNLTVTGAEPEADVQVHLSAGVTSYVVDPESNIFWIRFVNTGKRYSARLAVSLCRRTECAGWFC